MPSTVTDTESPGCIGPTPSGVPVRTTSPGSRVVNAVMCSISRGMSKTRSAVRASCFTSPLSRVVIARFAASSRPRWVEIQGPSGQNVSKPLARFHCRSLACRSRAVTSFAMV